MSAESTRTPRGGTARQLVRSLKPRAQIEVAGGTALTLLVLSCHREDTTGVDLASGALVRVRVDWPEDHGPDLAPFDVVEARLADEPERDDLAQPEAVTRGGPSPSPGHPARTTGAPTPPPPGRTGGGPCPRLPGSFGPLLGVPGSPALAGPHRSQQGTGALPTDRRPFGVGAASAGAEATTGSRWRTRRPSAPSTWPAGTACTARTFGRPRLQDPLPGGRPLHPA